MPIKIVPKEDTKTSGNKKMRSAAVREEMMDMMRAGEAPKDMKDRLDKVGTSPKVQEAAKRLQILLLD
jgi:hypothetical protein